MKIILKGLIISLFLAASLAYGQGNDEHTVLLLHFNGASGATSFIDDSLAGHHSVAANGNAQIDTAQSKFGGASGLFDGSGDYLTAADSGDWNFGSGDWTIEMWVRFPSANPIAMSLFDQYVDATHEVWVYIDSGGQFNFRDSSGQGYFYTSGVPTINADTWYHLAFVRNGATPYIFLDGVSQAVTVYTALGTLNDVAARMVIGARDTATPGVFFNGWIDELRISKGIARWTSNFTPPTAEYNEVVIIDPGLPYPRIANVYLLGSIDPANHDALAKYDLVVLGSIWTEAELRELRLRNPDIKIMMYVIAYALPASPGGSDPWLLENYNYANSYQSWWYNTAVPPQPASDWDGTQMVNITRFAPSGPLGSWRQYFINRLQDLVAARPTLDGIFFDNFWQQISWEQGVLQLDSNRDGIMDTDSELDTYWQEALTDIASQTKSLFDVAEPGRLQPLSIMGNGAGQYETWLNGSMFEHFPWISGMNEFGNPHNYVWNYLMSRIPGGYLTAPFRSDPYRTMIIAAEWDRAVPSGEPVRSADFERHKRFTLVSTLMGDGYYALDGARNGSSHSDLWWEPEYDHAGRQRGYLGYPKGPMYRVANPTGPEIINNGSFSEGLNNWQTQWYNGSSGTVDIDNAEFRSGPASLRMNVIAVPPTAYLKITQSPVNVIYNTAYTLSFWARSSINQEILLHLYSASCPGYRCLNDTRYNLTNEWTHYETSFTSTGTAASGLDFFVSNPGTVWIDDISLREGDSSFYRRDFDNGLVLLNYTDTAQSISLGANYRRLNIAGSDVWDGALISSETVPPYDARILLKANQPPGRKIKQEVSEIDLNGGGF